MAYVWSAELERVFEEHVMAPLWAGSKGREPAPLAGWLGFPFEEIRTSVVQTGLADFSQGIAHPTYGSLTADERVLLYCFVNLRQHLYASMATFQEYRQEIDRLFGGGERPLVVDLGSGPGTSALALAEVLNDPTKSFDYLPLDTAMPMLARSKSLIAAAKGAGVGRGSIGEILESLQPRKRVLLTCSFVFASHSLAVADAVALVRQIQGNANEVFLICYTNSTDQRANAKWIEFCNALSVANVASANTIQYLNKIDQWTEKSTTFVRELVRMR